MKHIFTRLFGTILFSFILVCFKSAIGQNPLPNAQEDPFRITSLPASPNAASLGKYGEIPVSLYTGIPNITIPIYEVQSGKLKLPVSLSYHAGGVKVEEIASSVGLGWSLHAGGVITRTIRGLPDREGSSAFFTTNINKIESPELTSIQKAELLYAVNNGSQDTEPDIYYFNFGGYSGKFVLNEDGLTGLPIPYQRLLIKHEKEFKRWIITTPDGVKYVFGVSLDDTRLAYEKNQTTTRCESGPFSLDEDWIPSGTIGEPSGLSPVTSWHLIEVYSATGEKIDLFYEPNRQVYATVASETYYYLDFDSYLMPYKLSIPPSPWNEPCYTCNNKFTRCYTMNDARAYHLSRINFPNGYLVFEPATKYRADLFGSKALSAIKLYKTDDTLEKSFILAYDYFKTPYSATPVEKVLLSGEEGFNYSDFSPYRLKLLSIQEMAPAGKTKPPHRFEYNEATALPDRLKTPEVYAQDHWGYYNGQTDNKRLAPSYYFESTEALSPIRVFKGAVKKTSSQHAQAGILTKIVYPTGGSTSFEYQSNTVPFSQVPSYYSTFYENKKWNRHALIDNFANPTQSTASLTFTIHSDLTESNTNIKGAYAEISITESGSMINPSNGCAACLNEASGIYLACSDSRSNVAYNNNWTIRNKTTGQILLNTQFVVGKKFLPNGDYEVILQKKTTTTCKSVIKLSISYEELRIQQAADADGNMEVGGLRISKITTTDGVSDLPQITTYSYHTKNKSNGVWINVPIYTVRDFTDDYVCGYPASNGLNVAISYSCVYDVHRSGSHYPLSSTHGAVVGYSSVLEIAEGPDNNGYTTYGFTTAQDYPDQCTYCYTFPFAPPEAVDWRRGFLRYQAYKSQTDNTVQEKRIIPTYGIIDGVSTIRQTKGLKVGLKNPRFNTEPGGIAPEGKPVVYVTYPLLTSPFIQQPYYTISEFFGTGKETVKIYDQNSPPNTNAIETSTEYKYSTKHLQVKEIHTTTSEGESLTTYRNYPEDYLNLPSNSLNPEVKGIKSLQDKHIITPIIEEYTVHRNAAGADAQVISGQITTYKPTEPNPDNVYSVETFPPQGLSEFKVSNSVNGVFDKDEQYNLRMTYHKFDANGNVRELTLTNGIRTVYLWGYSNSYLIAEIKNTTYEQVRDALGGQVEVDAIGNSSTLTEAQLNKIVSLRTGLPQAMVTTFTYKPLVGITSQTSPGGLTVYYEYDELNRLKLLKDHDQNIIKSYNYNYQIK